MVAAETRAASADGEAEGEIEAGDTPDVELSGAERGRGEVVFGVLPGLSRLPPPFEVMFAGAESKPPNTLATAGTLVPLSFLLLLLPLLMLLSERLARSESSVASEAWLPLRDILLGDSAMRLDLAAATGFAGRPAMPLSVSTPASTRLAGEGPPLAASKRAAATGLGGKLGLEPLC